MGGPRDGRQEAIDQGLLLYFPAPGSFTAEDLAEFHCHGGPVVMDMLAQRIVALGARHAEPGEFSQRAFLNGKLDLAQAEAIADLIAAASEGAARGALRSLQGDFSAKVSALAAEVTRLRVYVEAAMDFPEEEVDFLQDERIAGTLAGIQRQASGLLKAAGQGALLTEGAQVALAGKPNAGKSSLMNRLTGEDTAIVAAAPGTTRDLVAAPLLLDGIPLHLVDTAGLRKRTGKAEAEGIRRASRAIKAADLALLVIDASLPEKTRRQHLADLRQEATGSALLALNKSDLVADPSGLATGDFAAALPISCKTGAGLGRLRARLKKALGWDTAASGAFSARSRHLTALRATSAALASAASALQGKQAGELLAEELRLAQQQLGAITGEVTADDLLGEIFGSFCIGK